MPDDATEQSAANAHLKQVFDSTQGIVLGLLQYPLDNVVRMASVCRIALFRSNKGGRRRRTQPG